MKEDRFQVQRIGEKSRVRYGRLGRHSGENGFKCARCGGFVCTEPIFSGVQNRNHCPYCLWSRHLDLYVAGDRLSACRALMQPIGLTIKQTRKKYGPGRGELMLIHACTECNALSVNRIAADDDSQKVFAVFEGSYHIEGVILDDLGFYGIHLLGLGDSLFVRAQLFGNETDPAEICLQGCMMESTC